MYIDYMIRVLFMYTFLYSNGGLSYLLFALNVNNETRSFRFPMIFPHNFLAFFISTTEPIYTDMFQGNAKVSCLSSIANT